LNPARSARFERFARWIDAVLGFAAAAVLFCMMALTFVDVVGRYLFNHSVPGSFEITEIMMAMLIFAGLPLVSRREEHVTVDLVDHLLGARGRRAQRAVIEFVSGVLLLGLAHLLLNKAHETARYGDTTTVLQIKLAPFVYAMVLFVAVAGVIHVIKAFTPRPRERE
jgi:TRAP-type C4-dicarboxylate transport system permease small subunit